MSAAAAVTRRLTALVIVLLFAGVALRGLSGLLLGMHKSGADANRWSSLAPLRQPGDLVDTAAGVIRGWQKYAEVETSGVANAWDVVQWAMAVDSLFFAPAYALALFLFIRYARTRIEEWQKRAPPLLAGRIEQLGFAPADTLPAYDRAARFGLVAVVVAFVADEIENLLTLMVVGLGWHDHDGSGAFTAAVWGLWSFAWLKYLAVALALAIAALLALLLAGAGLTSPGGGWRAFAHRLRVLRLHVVLVVFAALALFLHEQIPDLVRRWTPLTLLATVALALGFALVIWLSTRRLLTIERWNPKRNEAQETRLERLILLGLAIVAAIQLVAHFLSHGEWDPGWGLAVPAVILLLTALAGRYLPDPGRAPRAAAAIVAGGHPRLPRFFAAAIAIAFALGVMDAGFAYAVYVHDVDWEALLPLVGALAGVLAHRLVRRLDPLLWATAGAFVGMFVLAAVRSQQVQPLVLVVTAILLGFLGWRLYDALESAPDPSPQIGTRSVAFAGAVVVAVVAGVIWKATWTGEHLGAVGVLFAFLFAVALAASLVAWAAPGLPVPRLFRTVHVRTFPILTLLALWLIIASNLDPGGYHDARVMEHTTRAASGVTLDEAFVCWLVKNGLPADGACEQVAAPPPSGAQPSAGTPLIFVATTGGGIRAAYWTDLVLDCAFETTGACPRGARTADFGRSNRLFAVSGISGGSFGLASYAAYLVHKHHGTPSTDWVRKALHMDALSGAGAWWLFVEVPRAFLQFDLPKDRAAVQEQGWEEHWPDGELGRGIFDVWHSEPQVPLLLLNGTSVTDGCRFEASVLDGNVERIVEFREGESPESAEARAIFSGCRSTDPFDDSPAGESAEPADPGETRVAPQSVLPGTRDLVDYLCGRNFDVRLSTAALFSGRFPFVNPSGRIERRCDTGIFRPPTAYVVDGGYLDTSGASPIFEITQSLGPLIDRWNDEHGPGCIVPLMIQIDNGFDAGAAHEARPKEILAPSETLSSSRLGRAGEARAGTALLFTTQHAGETLPVNRYAHFVNQVHAGPHAPLGWAQSEFSETELESQLRQPQNQQALKEVRRWLAPGAFRCAVGP